MLATSFSFVFHYVSFRLPLECLRRSSASNISISLCLFGLWSLLMLSVTCRFGTWINLWSIEWTISFVPYISIQSNTVERNCGGQLDGSSSSSVVHFASSSCSLLLFLASSFIHLLASCCHLICFCSVCSFCVCCHAFVCSFGAWEIPLAVSSGYVRHFRFHFTTSMAQ